MHPSLRNQPRSVLLRAGIGMLAVGAGLTAASSLALPAPVSPGSSGRSVNAASAQAAGISNASRALLAELGFNQAQIAQAASGTAVATIIKDSGDEAAQAGAVWVGVPQSSFAEQFTDIEAFERSDAVAGIKKMSEPPTAADFSSLDFPEKDVEDLRKCEVGSCAVKIGEAGLNRLRQQVDWSAAGALEQGRQVLREVLLGYVQAYQRLGSAGLPTFTDKRDPTSVKKDLGGILADSPYLARQAPALSAYLDSFPTGAPPNLDEFFYWQLANIGLKPIVFVDHAMILPAADNGGTTAIAVVQVYASHYFYASLQLYVLMPPVQGAEGFLLVVVNRSQSDGLTGFTGRLVRGKAERRGRDSLQRFLQTAKQRAEAATR